MSAYNRVCNKSKYKSETRDCVPGSPYYVKDSKKTKNNAAAPASWFLEPTPASWYQVLGRVGS